MLTNQTFSQIFNESLKEENKSSSDFSAGWESHIDAFGLTQLITELQFIKPTSYRAVAKAYPFKQRPKAPLVLRPAHLFNESQAAAFAEIKRHSEHLPDNFTCAELKSAFRRSVLKTHPDKGGDSESFQLVKKSYHILQAFVKNEA